MIPFVLGNENLSAYNLHGDAERTAVQSKLESGYPELAAKGASKFTAGCELALEYDSFTNSIEKQSFYPSIMDWLFPKRPTCNRQ